MPTIYINVDIHFTLEKVEKIEYLKANKLIKMQLRRIKKSGEVCKFVIQQNRDIRFYSNIPKVKRNKKK